MSHHTAFKVKWPGKACSSSGLFLPNESISSFNVCMCSVENKVHKEKHLIKNPVTHVDPFFSRCPVIA